jgi:DNA-binding transcriptional MerR regulator
MMGGRTTMTKRTVADGEMTTRELLDHANRERLRITYGTLRFYTYLGLIAKPRKVSGGRARGVKGYYPAAALGRLRQIRELQGSGLTLEEICRDLVAVPAGRRAEVAGG